MGGDERTRRTGGRRALWSGQDMVQGRREGFCGQGDGRPDWAATETLSAAWLPPKDLASPPAQRISLLHLPSLLFHHSLLHFSLFSFCSFPPSPSSPSCSLPSSHSFPPFLSLPLPPPHHPSFTSVPLQTLNSGLRGGGEWLRWWDEEIEGAQKPQDAAARREWLALKRSRTAS